MGIRTEIENGVGMQWECHTMEVRMSNLA